MGVGVGRRHTPGLGVGLLLLAASAAALSAEGGKQAGEGTTAAAKEGRYEIVRTTESRVWRLDTQTGEVAVCSLRGDRLVCTSSSAAARPEAKSYTELEAEAAAREAGEEREQLRLIDKVLALLREFIAYALNRTDGEAAPGETATGPES